MDAKWKLRVLGAVLTWVALGAPAFGEQFRKTYNPENSGFLTSIERVGRCEISTPPVSVIRVPYQLYPPKSVQFHEEGVVQVELVFDDDWGVRKATIVQSTGHWRLDEVSLNYMMTLRYQPKPEALKFKDGETTMIFRLGWGVSQG